VKRLTLREWQRHTEGQETLTYGNQNDSKEIREPETPLEGAKRNGAKGERSEKAKA
jgi:hypothetical protein